MGPISGLVPMIHVADVERAVGFYRLLGFEIGNRVPASGQMICAWLYSPNAPDWKRGANLMIARGVEAGEIKNRSTCLRASSASPIRTATC
jgi:hypothetical protein